MQKKGSQMKFHATVEKGEQEKKKIHSIKIKAHTETVAKHRSTSLNYYSE